ncbi:MAG: NADP-dependent isocitrate dehydrogenase, partial [Syntrophales bacterium]|nr:NADP-dependent isocitrate dehydrogenase [Syntrophales bacterium]
ALIFAWTGGLRKRGQMDGTPEVVAFADTLEAAALETVEGGIMTGDLLAVADPHPANRRVTTVGFIDAIGENLEKRMNQRCW